MRRNARRRFKSGGELNRRPFARRPISSGYFVGGDFKIGELRCSRFTATAVLSAIFLPLPRDYRNFFLPLPREYRRNFSTYRSNTAVTTVLPLSPLPCHSLLPTPVPHTLYANPGSATGLTFIKIGLLAGKLQPPGCRTCRFLNRALYAVTVGSLHYLAATSGESL